MCMAFPFASCKNGGYLESPTGFNLDENYNLSWSPVENARSYMLEITNVESGVINEATARRENVALSYLAVGDYDIRVRAVGDGSRFYDSDWSTSVSLSRAPESACQYKLINNGSEYEISSVSATVTELVLENTYRGKPVTSIGSSSFRRASSLETLVIGDYVTNIGENAFYNCKSLKSITIPDGVTSIGFSAFQSCISLESIKIPAGVTALADNTFSYCRNLKEIDLNNVTVIGNAAFESCISFTEFTVPDQIVSIGNSAFTGMTALKEITLGSGVVSIGNYCFNACTALDTVNFSKQSSLQTIGFGAFQYCTALQKIDLPNGLESIGQGTFMMAEKLNSVSIPDSVTEVGYSAFYATKIYMDAVEAGDMLVYVDNWLVNKLETTEKKIYNLYAENPQNLPDTYVIREDTVGIANSALSGASELYEVVLPKSVKYVGMYAFYGCPMLFRFVSDNTELVSLGLGAFMDDEELHQVVFDRSNTSKLKEIDSYAFYGCKNLNYSGSATSSRFIPLSVDRIGTFAFFDTALYKSADEDGVIYADDWVVGSQGSPTVEEDANGEWHMVAPSNPKPTITLREDVRGISDYAFHDCSELTTVGNSYRVEKIGRGAFYNCEKLEGFVMSPDLTRIEDYAFYGCTNLVVDSLPIDLRSIGRSAFYNCTQMRQVNMPEWLESVGDFAYYNCINLTSLRIGPGLTRIGDYTFYGCSRLMSVTVPSNIVKIGNSAFSNCTSLRELVLEEGVKEIGDFAFRSDVSLLRVNLPDSVKKVGDSAFLQCESVLEIDLGQVEDIGDFAFAENFGVRSLVIPESVKTIGNGAFYYLGTNAEDESGNKLGGVTSVIVAGSPDRIGANAFYGCNFATVYLTDDNRNAEWGTGWNSSRRPAVWGVTLSEDKSYVVSVTVGENTFEYYDALNALSAPYRAGYTFAGWSVTENGTEIAYTVQNVITAPVGTTLYAVYIQN